MFDFFQLSGNIPSPIQFLNRFAGGFTIAESHIFNIFVDISSYPCAFNYINGILFSNLIEQILAFVIYLWKYGMLLSLFYETNWDERTY